MPEAFRSIDWLGCIRPKPSCCYDTLERQCKDEQRADEVEAEREPKIQRVGAPRNATGAKLGGSRRHTL